MVKQNNKHRKVLKNRRKMSEITIYKNDSKNVALDFFIEMEFNKHAGCEAPPFNCI